MEGESEERLGCFQTFPRCEKKKGRGVRRGGRGRVKADPLNSSNSGEEEGEGETAKGRFIIPFPEEEEKNPPLSFQEKKETSRISPLLISLNLGQKKKRGAQRNLEALFPARCRKEGKEESFPGGN